MRPLSTPPELLDRYIRDSEHGNHTSVQVAAPPSVVWAALHQVRLKDCRASRVLLAVRTLPRRLTHNGVHGSAPGGATATDVPLLELMSRDRFIILDEVSDQEIVLGVIGQFWKLHGGTDAPVGAAAQFVAFDQPGYVKAALNFRVQATPTGCTLTTETRCRATDPATARRFSLYWALVGWGSKLIRQDIRPPCAAAPRPAGASERMARCRWLLLASIVAWLLACGTTPLADPYAAANASRSRAATHSRRRARRPAGARTSSRAHHGSPLGPGTRPDFAGVVSTYRTIAYAASPS